MTMMVNLDGGREDTMDVTLLTFQNPYRSYEICGLADEMQGVAYRSSPMRFMDCALFCERLNERRISQNFLNVCILLLFVEN